MKKIANAKILGLKRVKSSLSFRFSGSCEFKLNQNSKIQLDWRKTQQFMGILDRMSLPLSQTVLSVFRVPSAADADDLCHVTCNDIL